MDQGDDAQATFGCVYVDIFQCRHFPMSMAHND